MWIIILLLCVVAGAVIGFILMGRKSSTAKVDRTLEKEEMPEEDVDGQDEASSEEFEEPKQESGDSTVEMDSEESIDDLKLDTE